MEARATRIQNILGSSAPAHNSEHANWLAGDFGDNLVHLAVGSSPASLADKYETTIASASVAAVQQFNSLCIISAAANKRAVGEVLSRDGMRDCLSYIKSAWMIRNDVNNSSLNMIGHMLLTTDYLNKNRMAIAYRARLCGKSIWHVNIEASKLSASQKKIITEKLAIISANDAINAGERIARAAYKKVHNVSTPDSETAVRMEEDTRKRKQVEEDIPVSADLPDPEVEKVFFEELPTTVKALIRYARMHEDSAKRMKGEVAIALKKAADLTAQYEEQLMLIYGHKVEVVFPQPSVRSEK